MFVLKDALVLAIFMCFLMLIFSCYDSNIANPNFTNDWYNDYSDYLDKENICIGKLHNIILINFNIEHNLLKGGKLHAQEFVNIFKKAANEAFETQGLSIRVEDKDIVEVLGVFLYLRNEGAANVFNPSKEIPQDFLDYLVSQSIISQNEKAKYLDAYKLIENNSKQNIKDDPNKYLSSVVDRGSAKDRIFFDITSSSIKFWTSMFEVSSSDTTIPAQNDDELFNEKVNYCVMLWWDMSGSLIGGMFGGFIGAAIGTAMSSIAYVIWGEQEVQDLLDNYAY